MKRLDNLKVGARVRHWQDSDLEGVVTEIKGDWVFVQVPGDPEPRRSMWGFWEVLPPTEPRVPRYA